jgi:hypothetical protein
VAPYPVAAMGAAVLRADGDAEDAAVRLGNEADSQQAHDVRQVGCRDVFRDACM